ncbi:haloalkane dehalogenase [Streptomyces caniscabiei]|uniref:haloalkane dehalogenase n=1 Tax=Streptomyces caniscabiei TaxID=2746961 RepID=UPI001C50221E|nr:haloalkane dehalogenase [Streptomyces caniscabiei]
MSNSTAGMHIERTPDERFEGLADWPYEPHYVTVGDGLRMHYVDEGPADGPVVILAHGEPSWGYLYRKMIPGLVAAGRRVLVPDLIGFGRSDKPVDRAAYTYESHIAWTGDWLDQLGLTGITLFGQDWGGYIFNVHVGLTPDRFVAVVASNTGLTDPDFMASLTEEQFAQGFSAFLEWREMSEAPDLTAARAVAADLSVTGDVLTEEEAAAYDAPFPSERYFAGARQFPHLVTLKTPEPLAATLRSAWAGLEAFDKPFLTAFAEHDHISRPFEGIFQARVPGAKGQKHVTVPDAGHFLQEQQPDLLVEAILSLG